MSKGKTQKYCTRILKIIRIVRFNELKIAQEVGKNLNLKHKLYDLIITASMCEIGKQAKTIKQGRMVHIGMRFWCL